MIQDVNPESDYRVCLLPIIIGNFQISFNVTN